MKEANFILVGLLIAFILWWIFWRPTEGLSGFGVTSGLAFNDRVAYCDKGQDSLGGAYSGGCFLPHRVII